MIIDIKRKPGELYLDKLYFKTKMVTDEGHYIIFKGPIHQDLTTVNIYAPKTEAPKYINQLITNIKNLFITIQ